MNELYFVPDGTGGFRPGTLEEMAEVYERSQEPFRKGGRRVAYTELPDNVFVSTVFLCIDHAFGGGPPILFETMICRDGRWDEQWRYETVEEAEQNHAQIVAELTGAI